MESPVKIGVGAAQARHKENPAGNRYPAVAVTNNYGDKLRFKRSPLKEKKSETTLWCMDT
jgi:hypothetical protein